MTDQFKIGTMLELFYAPLDRWLIFIVIDNGFTGFTDYTGIPYVSLLRQDNLEVCKEPIRTLEYWLERKYLKIIHSPE